MSRPRLLLGVRRHDIEPVEAPVEGPSISRTTGDPSTGSTYVFHLAPGRRRIALLTAGLLAVAALVYSLTLFAVEAALRIEGPVAYWLILAPTALLLLTSLVVLRANRRIRLELGPDGVALHAFGSVVRCRWSDVRTIAPVRWGFVSRAGLILARPAELKASRFMRWLGLTASRDIVPLVPFADPLSGSELEARLRQHSPRLFAGPLDRLPSAHA